MHFLRVDVSKIWFNCMEYNGIEHAIYRQALILAKLFDERFEAAIPPPQHMGIRRFQHGDEWVGRDVVVYWDGDHKWFKARVVAYLGASGDRGHQYRIQYPDDDETENVTLPDVNVAFVDLIPASYPHLDPLATWPIADSDPASDTPAQGPASMPAHAATVAPTASATAVADRPVRDRQPPAKLQVGLAELRGRGSVGGGGLGDVTAESRRGRDAPGAKAAGAGEDKGGGSGFIGDDGMPCTLVQMKT